MRNAVHHLKSSDLEWEAVGTGVYAKMLNDDEESGARTGLFKFIPAEGMKAPGQCHYHSVYEELLVLDGRVTFDGETWLTQRSYAFHPPFLVHGFGSSVPGPMMFLARSPKELDFNFPDAPDAKSPFLVEGHTASRDWTYIANTSESPWTPLYAGDGTKVGERFMLSEDRTTGEQSSLVRYNPGWTCAALPQGFDSYDEAFILEGELHADTGTIWSQDDYWHRRPGTPIPALSAPGGALIYSSTGGKRVY